MIAGAAAQEPSRRRERPGATGAPVLDDDLLAAGRRVLERHGLARATLERIAEESGLSRVTLYRRGITRELILGALAERAVEEYRRSLWPALTAAGTGAERLRQALGAVCQVAERNLELLLALGERLGPTSDRRASEEEGAARRAFAEPLERLLRDGAADGSLRATDTREEATVLLNLVGWTYVHLRAGEKWSPRRARRATLRAALNGVVAPLPDERAARAPGR